MPKLLWSESFPSKIHLRIHEARSRTSLLMKCEGENLFSGIKTFAITREIGQQVAERY